MESANRVLTRNALDVLKSIATGEYKTPEEREAAAATETVSDAVAEESETAIPEIDADSSSAVETKS
jgi:hypothetical protein